MSEPLVPNFPILLSDRDAPLHRGRHGLFLLIADPDTGPESGAVLELDGTCIANLYVEGGNVSVTLDGVVYGVTYNSGHDASPAFVIGRPASNPGPGPLEESGVWIAEEKDGGVGNGGD